MIKNIFTFYLNNKYSNMPKLMILVLILGFFEFIGIGLFIPLLDNSDNILNQSLNGLFHIINMQRTDLTISIFILFVFLFKLFIVIIFNKKLSFDMNNFVFNVRNSIVQNISKMKYSKVQTYQIGELNNLVTKESERISEGYTYVLDIVLKILLTFVYITISFMTNIYATIFAVVLGFLFVLGFKKIVRLSKMYSKEMLDTNEQTNSYINEFLHGLKYLFATNGFSHININLAKLLKSYSMAKYKLDFYGKLSKQIPEPIGVMIIITVIIFNYLYIHNSTMSVLMSAVLLYKTFQNITSLQYVYQKLMGVSASINKVNQFLEELDKYKEDSGNIKTNKISNISFNNLQFSYENNKVINNISLKFNKNKVYAFVGSSGSGKTTLLNILTLLYEVDLDSYTINENDSLSLDKKQFRSKIGYVSQEPLYFDGSIKENITFYNDYLGEEIENIISRSGLEMVVKEKGLNTKIQSFGKDFSGGQLQRINIARELIKQPEILILDEATSALDANVEKEIMTNILALKKDMIIIVVAHRLSTLINVDEILYLDNGKIVDSGTMVELYKINYNFKELCNNQNIYLEKDSK